MVNENYSEKERQNVKYWTKFCDHLSQRGSQLQSRTSKVRHFIDFRIDTGCFLRARQVINPSTAITVAFVMKGTAKTYFHSLKEQQAEIENEFGESLRWFSGWETESHVWLIKEDIDPTDEEDWPNQHEWIATKLEKLNEIFRPRIERLKSETT